MQLAIVLRAGHRPDVGDNPVDRQRSGKAHGVHAGLVTDDSTEDGGGSRTILDPARSQGPSLTPKRGFGEGCGPAVGVSVSVAAWAQSVMESAGPMVKLRRLTDARLPVLRAL